MPAWACTRAWKEMKYGIATAEPQLPSSAEHPPLASSTMASAINRDQPSLVRHCSSTRNAFPIESKLRSSLMPSRASSSFSKSWWTRVLVSSWNASCNGTMRTTESALQKVELGPEQLYRGKLA